MEATDASEASEVARHSRMTETNERVRRSMAWIAAGSLQMGSEVFYPAELEALARKCHAAAGS